MSYNAHFPDAVKKEINQFFRGNFQPLNPMSHAIYNKYAEIRAQYKGRYFIALHGSTTKMMIIQDLYKQIEILKNPDKIESYKHFKYFRQPGSSENSYTNIQDFFDKHLKPNNIPNDMVFDHYYSDELLSIDFYDENTDHFESAFFFATRNRNIFPNKLLSLVNKLLKFYSIPDEKSKEIHEVIEQIVTKLKKENSYTDSAGKKRKGPGNLYCILIPKELMDEEKHAVGYLSKKYGLRLELKEGETREVILEAMQSRDTSKFDTGWNCTQGRLICSELGLESGIKMYRINSFSKKFKLEYRNLIKQLAALILKYSGNSTFSHSDS